MRYLISNHLNSLDPSPTLLINERVNQIWAQKGQVYHLGFGESRFPVHPKLQEALQANAHQHSYLPAQGLPELREQIAGFYKDHLGIDAAASQVIVGPGSKALIFALQMALEAELILPTPSWVSYAPQAHLLGRAVRYVPASAENDYALELEALQHTVSQSTHPYKILLLNSPNNPTGRMFEASFLEALADYCRREGIIVLSDEIYALLPHGNQAHISIARYYPEGTVVLGGLSKHLSLGGWRLGLAITPPGPAGARLMHPLRVIASEIWSTPAAPVQYAALAAYSRAPEVMAYIDQCAQLHAIRTRYLYHSLSEIGIRCTQPQGGFYFVANFDRWHQPLARLGVHTSDDLANYLLEVHQLATLPGSAFGIPAQSLSLRLATSYLDLETEAKARTLLAAYRDNPDPQVLMQRWHPNMNEAISHFGQFIEHLFNGAPARPTQPLYAPDSASRYSLPGSSTA